MTSSCETGLANFKDGEAVSEKYWNKKGEEFDSLKEAITITAHTIRIAMSHPVAHGCLMVRHPKVSPAVLDRPLIVGIHRMLRVIKEISFFLPSVPPIFRRDLRRLVAISWRD